MISNYLKIAVRNIAKRKLYSVINAAGLSIGIAFCVLIVLFIRDEQNFDRMHANAARIYRIEARSYDTWKQDPSNMYSRHAWLQAGLRHALKDEIPEVEKATRFNSGATAVFRAGEKVFTEKITYIDGDFFTMFSFRLISGNKDKLFNNKFEVVLTPAIAQKYFGEENPMGKTVLIDDEGEKSFTVTGIIEAPPANSSLEFQILVPQENRPYYDRQITQWGNFNTPTFVQLPANADLTNFSRNLDKMIQKMMGDKLKKWREESVVPVPKEVKMLELEFTALPDWHLKKEIGWTKVSDPQYSLILGAIALTILLIACINYISLALTTSTARRTEVGIRKAIGAQKSQLIYQFGLESLMLAVASTAVGLLFAFLFLPAFNQFTGKSIVLDLSNFLPVLSASLIMGLLVGVLAGSYPALFLSGFRPALVLKGYASSKVSAGFTKPLVVLQFILSACLIISSVIMYRQMEYVTTKDLGYHQEQIIVVPTQTGWNPEADKTVERFRTRAQQEPSILSVTGTTSSFNQGYSRYGYKIKGDQHNAYVYGVDPYYLPTLGATLVMGRNFDAAIAADSGGVIVNEALVRDMKWKDPLHEYLNWREDSVGLGSPVIGVVKDYHFLSLEENIEPMFLSMNKRDVGYLVNMMIKVAPGDLTASVARIEKLWKERAPDRPFDYTFLDQDIARQYESYQRWMSIMGLATGFAVLISCLGLFGLAGINAVNRTKEIGIRKVMGADLSTIFMLLNRQFVFLSLIAFAIAAPLAWYLMNRWLDGFKFRIALGWELFAVSMLAGLAVALATVSYHAIRASMVNPAETLKYE